MAWRVDDESEVVQYAGSPILIECSWPLGEMGSLGLHLDQRLRYAC